MENYGMGDGAVSEMSYEQIENIAPPPAEKKGSYRRGPEFKALRVRVINRVKELMQSGETAKSTVRILQMEKISKADGTPVDEGYVYSIRQQLSRPKDESRGEAAERHLKSLAEEASDYVGGPTKALGGGDDDIPRAILQSESLSDEKKVRMLKAYFLEA